MAVKCQNCGSENKDPGGDLQGYRCGSCGQQSLVRIPNEEDKTGRIAASGLGAAIGAGVLGPIGAIIGAGIGYLIGEEADKKNKNGSA